MNIPNTFDLYLEDKLSDAEKNLFEKELSEQPGLAESYKVYAQINRFLKDELKSPLLYRDYEDDLILKDLSISQRLEIEDDFIRFSDSENIEEESEKKLRISKIPGNNTTENFAGEQGFIMKLKKVNGDKSAGKNVKYRFYTGIAATLLLCLFAGRVIFSLFQKNTVYMSPVEAFALYYNPNDDEELKSLHFEDARLKTAFRDFKRSGISESSIFSNQMAVSDEDYIVSLLCLGIINMERSNYVEARKCFDRVMMNTNSSKIHTARYYMSLILLSQDNLKDAQPLLEQLKKSKNPYQKRVKAIIDSVKPE